MVEYPIPSDTLESPSNVNNCERTSTASDAPLSKSNVLVDSQSDTTTRASKRPRTISSEYNERVEEQHAIPSASESNTIRASNRPRTISSNTDNGVQEQQSISPDFAFERRRVNPESLALRLGSVLVRDLDALVPPGSREIPSFELRRVVQERHNIDRRHVYDYYHSKGLRVLKEGSGTTSKSTLQAAISSQLVPRARRQAPIRLSSSLESPAVIKRKMSKPRQAKAHTAPPKRKPAGVRKLLDVTMCSPTPQPGSHSPTLSSRSPMSDSAILDVPFVPSHFFTNPMVPFEISEDDFQSNAVFDQSNIGGRLHNHNRTANPDNPIFDKMAFQHVGTSVLPENYQSSAPSSTRYERLPMTQAERMEFYDFLDGVIGPAHGVQESVGTYKTYMEHQSRLRSERTHDKGLFAKLKANKVKEKSSTLYSASQAQDCSSTSSENSVNWRSWLGPGSNQDLHIPTRPIPFYDSDGIFSALALKERAPTVPSREPSFVPFQPLDAFGQTFDDQFPDLEESSSTGALESLVPVDGSKSIALPDLRPAEDLPTPSPQLLPPDLHRSQSNSPDPESSPIIQTPTPVYQQFAQAKGFHLGSSHPVLRRAHWTPTIQSEVNQSDAQFSNTYACSGPKRFSNQSTIYGAISPAREQSIRTLASHARLRTKSGSSNSV